MLSLLLPESLGMPLPESINHMQTIPWWEPKRHAYTKTWNYHQCGQQDLTTGMYWMEKKILFFLIMNEWTNCACMHFFSALREVRDLKITIPQVLKRTRTIQKRLCDWWTLLNLTLLEKWTETVKLLQPIYYKIFFNYNYISICSLFNNTVVTKQRVKTGQLIFTFIHSLRYPDYAVFYRENQRCENKNNKRKK